MIKHSWGVNKSKRNITAHIDFVKFGDPDYGYGLGSVDMQGREPPLSDRTYSTYKSWGSVPKQKPTAMQPKYRISEAEKFDPTQFEKHQLTLPVHTEELQAINVKPQTFLKAKDDKTNPD